MSSVKSVVPSFVVINPRRDKIRRLSGEVRQAIRGGIQPNEKAKSHGWNTDETRITYAIDDLECGPDDRRGDVFVVELRLC